MVKRREFLLGGAALLGLALTGRVGLRAEELISHSDTEWRELLTHEQYAVLRDGGTEEPYSSPLLHETRAGHFACAGCDQPLFASEAKFDSGTGWPSFWQPLERAVVETRDSSLDIERTAVSCRRCQGHLGHVFADGPAPTGLRYCMNGSALSFVAA